jgi:hypothetical protein
VLREGNNDAFSIYHKPLRLSIYIYKNEGKLSSSERRCNSNGVVAKFWMMELAMVRSKEKLRRNSINPYIGIFGFFGFFHLIAVNSNSPLQALSNDVFR